MDSDGVSDLLTGHEGFSLPLRATFLTTIGAARPRLADLASSPKAFDLALHAAFADEKSSPLNLKTPRWKPYGALVLMEW